ncbi:MULTISPECIES: hypothetical protein [Pseudoalteromonas]|uniref:hypothetical protein n=1 Tax=Pseudoalteromonas TaxID=53246 RepID=UPI0006B5ABE9|nr:MULTISPECIES: hypothetical protein [Pseudoalteromonas]TMP23776.1 hypothetical protein CWC06_09490 [Pseudoalteromonas ruthenica]GAP76990.1 hypothetical protein W04_3569 [Pseudoalteromonas sp. SW0106-04]|tara:strand:- start:17734 stop:18033 length:300 start_codon:yes stop_codon:yes gene_type:complete
MSLLKKQLAQSLAVEQQCILNSGEAGLYQGQPITVELDKRFRTKQDPYSGEQREQITVIRFLNAQCSPNVHSWCEVEGKSYQLTELYERDEISTTFIVI